MSTSRLRRRVHAILGFSITLAGAAVAQVGPINGMRPAEVRTHAITGATVIPSPGVMIENATIIIREGVIIAAGADAVIPPEARVWKAEGLTIYPGLIDASVLITPADVPASGGDHWNPRVHPELSMADQPAPEADLRKDLRELGFTAAAFYPNSGIFRGSGVVLALADETEHVLAYGKRAAMMAALEHGGGGGAPGPGPGRREGGGGGGGGYPGSLMGAMALVRQTLHDAKWHQQCRLVWADHPQGNQPPLRADALAALGDLVEGRQQVIFDVSDEHNALRAARIVAEYKLDGALLGSGHEFRRVDEVAATRLPVIVPLQFPEKPKVASLVEADRVSLSEMMTWEQSPTNARRLQAAGVEIALTTHRLRNRRDFPAALASAVQHGLSEDAALEALTIAPAKLLGLEDVLGTIEPGKAANLVIVKGSLFEKKPEVQEVWINGRRHEVEAPPAVQLVGEGVMQGHDGREWTVEIDTTKPTLSLGKPEGKKTKAKNLVVQEERISFVMDGEVFDAQGYVRLTGVISDGAITGTGEKPDATKIDFTITMRQKRDEPAPAPRGDAAEQPPAVVDDTGFSGVWSINLTSERMRRPMPAVLTLQREGDVITGSFRSRDNEYVLKNGHYDAAKGEATAEYVGSSSGDSTLTASVEGDAITGTVRNERFSAEFTGVRGEIDPEVAERARDEADFEMPPEALNHPLGEYGLAEAPQPQTVLVTGATLWTCGPEGIVQNGWMLVRDGKIAQMGAGGWPRIGVDAVIDAAGKHITPGLIDCHSHTGIDGGVNEGHQANTAEVRIGDCIDPDDINWYRELAGGLTACNQLHGSANPIGGQNSVVKLKWGRPASAYPIQGAIAGIKFALGENVVRSQGRYPNTRMGVETFIRDAFTAARDYEAEHARYAALGADEKARTMPPRRDLELDALVEILHGERLVHCHSYRQDEILMLIRLAEQFGFRIGTFQHVLEGYKVADAIAAHGAGASSFSDWWAYKVEVMDAIPYNGAILHDVGAVVSFNSDSNELARRMNTEAAKAVRYGGLSPEEALKFVTLNPARQLRIDDRVGSLEVGKDADFVIWSGDPLSTYTRCEQTWIEGARYFDLETDARLRAEAQSERQRLAQKILAQTHGKKPSLAPSTPPEAGPDEVAPPGSTEEGPDRPTTCAAHADARASSGAPDESMPLLARMMEARRKWMEEQVRLGRDPAEMSPGDCGCGGAADLYFMMGGY